MAFINYAGREICCKIVYYGPGLCGKTTNVRYIFERTAADHRGKLISLDTDTDRTLFFDFLPLDLGTVNGFKMRLSLYTVPGQIHYQASRRLIMRGVDGVVFVADSQYARLDADVQSLTDLQENLEDHGLPFDRMPFVVQYNKRDLPGLVPVEELRALLNPQGAPDFEASAHSGRGVVETLRAVSRLTLRDLKTR